MEGLQQGQHGALPIRAGSFLGFPFAVSIFQPLKGVPDRWHAPACFATSRVGFLSGQLCAWYALDVSAWLGDALFQCVGRAGWGEVWAQSHWPTRLTRCCARPGGCCAAGRGLSFIWPSKSCPPSSACAFRENDRWSDPGVRQLCCVLPHSGQIEGGMMAVGQQKQ